MQKIVWLLLLFSFSCWAQGSFTLSSSALINQSIIPSDYTCQGKDISPPLTWTNVPDKTLSLVLLISDLDASDAIFYHWILYQIPKNTVGLDEDVNQLPEGTLIGKNGWNIMKYNGPCPPKGDMHHYTFTLYALDVRLRLKTGASAEEVLKAMDQHILATSSFEAKYGY